MRRWIPVVLLALPLALAPAPARAGTVPCWGRLIRTPERATAHEGVSFGDDSPSGASEGIALGTGPVVEASIGLGVERFVTWICGIDHLRETIAFPRMLYRIYP